MKLYERFGDKGFHTSIVTTFGIDFTAYESIILPRLRGAGCYNNLLLADSRMLTYALDGTSVLPRYAGRHYTITPVKSNGVFHPKITIQLGRHKGHLMIASANVTASGLGGNRELAGMVDCTAEETGERRLVAAAWQYVSAQINRDQQALAHQLDWARARTTWLWDAEPADGRVTLTDGSIAALLTSGDTTGIGARYVDFVEGQPVDRLIVVSPYWDDDLSSLKQFTTAIGPKEVIIFIDCDKQLFPRIALEDFPQATIYDLGDLSKDRFVHAKLFVAETALADHVLFGSANCTAAALGTPEFTSSNAEACLYRQLPPKTILTELGLTKLLEKSNPRELSDIPEYRKDEELLLEEAALRSPGRFECVFDTLIWHLPSAMPTEPDQIELLDAESQILPATLSELSGTSENMRHYQINGLSNPPSFARLRFEDDSTSAPSIITLVDKVRETVREARGKKAESAAAQLADGTEEELWLLEVMDELETAEATLHENTDPGASRKRKQASERSPEMEYGTLDYEHFIAGRRIRTEGHGVSRNSLAGTELSLVRNFLNRVLAVGEMPLAQQTSFEAEESAAGLDLGDEISDAQGAMESGEEFFLGPEVVTHEIQKEIERKKAVRRRATRKQIAETVNQFNKRILEKAKLGGITSFDVLRLRAVLTIVAAAGQPIKAKSGHTLTSLQILPPDYSTESWPMLMGRTLFTFFGGKHPPIRQVQIEKIHDQMPDDILECWATCFWASQICTLAINSHDKLAFRSQRMIDLMQKIYALTSLRSDELNDGIVINVISQMNERFADRLGLDSSQVEHSHTKIIKESIMRASQYPR
ncbi:MAG: hypothetical protein OXI37_05765 [Gammaproteobacteria bacterium]|nr:hypothetical protein [Gammaproteobacteria bacterium]